MAISLRTAALCASVCVACASLAAILPPGGVLAPGQAVDSDNGAYRLVMQHDGNLVHYRLADGSARWHSRTFGSPGAFAAMQHDGNFVVYSGAGTGLWHTRSDGHPGAYVAVQDDGNLVLYGAAGALWWHTGPAAAPGDPQLAGDVVGRELDLPGLGALGHTGMYDGAAVVQVTSDGGGNAVRYEPLAGFKARSAYWGSAAPHNPNHLLTKCFRSSCHGDADMETVHARMALVRRAFQAYLIGADYSYGTHWRSARPAQPGVPAQRGLYRCDTFIVNVYEKTAQDEGQGSIHPMPPDWLARNFDLANGEMLPRSVFNKLKSWPQMP